MKEEDKKECEHNFIPLNYQIHTEYVGDGTGKVPCGMTLLNVICTKCGEKRDIVDPDLIIF